MTQNNLAMSYHDLGRLDEANRMLRDVYSGKSKILGKEHEETLRSANNYAAALKDLLRFEEAKSLLRKTIPVARRVLGNNDGTMIVMRWIYAEALYRDDGATLDDLREAVTTLADAGRIARRVLGGAHPNVKGMDIELRRSRAALRARETPPPRA